MPEEKKTVRATVVAVSLGESDKLGRVTIEMEDDGLRMFARLFGKEIAFPIGEDDG